MVLTRQTASPQLLPEIRPCNVPVASLIEQVHARTAAYGEIPADRIGSNIDVSTYHTPSSREWARQLGDSVSAVAQGRRYPACPVYPFSAFRLAAVVAAYEASSHYVLLDNHPFLYICTRDELPNRSEAIPTAMASNEMLMVYEINSFFSRFGGMLPVMLGRMIKVFPSFRVRRVQYFVEGGLISYKVSNPTPDTQCHPCHGIIDFDFGAGTHPKTAVYVNARLASSAGDHPVRFAPDAHCSVELGFTDGLFVRGSAGYFHRNPWARDWFLRIVSGNKGMVVEASAKGRYEFSLPDEPLPGSARTYIDPQFPLSAKAGLCITSFDECR